MSPDLASRIEFLCQMDALKGVNRKTKPTGLDRYENSAEHSWHVMLAVMVLAPHANEPVDQLRVMQMLAVHDIPEIETGDHFHYAKSEQANLAEEEDEAAQKLFGPLPSEQKEELLGLFREFQARETTDAKFAHAVDRLAAFLLNSRQGGGTWKIHGVTREMVEMHGKHAADGSVDLYQAALDLYDQAMACSD